MTAAYSVASTSYTNVTGLVITVPEDGNYDLLSCLELQVASNSSIFAQFAVNSNSIGGTPNGPNLAVMNSPYLPLTLAMNNMPLKAGDVVSVMAKYTTSAGAVAYAATNYTPFIQIIKRGV